MTDLTLVYYTANVIPEAFARSVRERLLHAAQGQPIISVSKQAIGFGDLQIQSRTPRSHLNIYRDALLGAYRAQTRYIALCEDDTLYSPEHFKQRSSPGRFAYNLGTWNLYTWQRPALFTAKLGGRKNLNGLICERALFIEAMEERFMAWPNDADINLGHWAEPGKYETHLGVTVREVETFATNPPNIVFSHQTALAFENLGTRKRLGEIRAVEIPYWGNANTIVELYQ